MSEYLSRGRRYLLTSLTVNIGNTVANNKAVRFRGHSSGFSSPESAPVLHTYVTLAADLVETFLKSAECRTRRKVGR